jgi:hypothetical protein
MNNDTNTIDITTTALYASIKAKVKAYYLKAVEEKRVYDKPATIENEAFNSLTEEEKTFINPKRANLRLPCFTLGRSESGVVVKRGEANIVHRGPNTGKTSKELGENEKKLLALTNAGLLEVIPTESLKAIQDGASKEKAERETLNALASVGGAKKALESAIDNSTTSENKAKLYTTLASLVSKYTLRELAAMAETDLVITLEADKLAGIDYKTPQA